MKGTYALIIAVALAIASVFAVRSYIVHEREKVAQKLEPVEVLQASRAIEPGTKLSPGDLALKEVPMTSISRDHILSSDYPSILGRTTIKPLDRGDPILWSYLTPEEPVTDELRLLPGERAITIAVNQVTGVAGLLRPNSRVDILCTIRPMKSRQGETPEEITLTILTNVLVLAVDDLTGPPISTRETGRPKGYTTVTVAVSPLEAQLIAYAQKHGVLTLTMRKEGDKTSVGKLPILNSETFHQIIEECRLKREEELNSSWR